MTSELMQAKHVSKRYGPITALRDITLTFPQGKVIGLIGPNGSGKTTLLKLLAGLIHPTEGQLLLHGKAINRRDATRISYLSEVDTLYPFFSVKESMEFKRHHFRDFNPQKATQLLELFDLDQQARVTSLSYGQRQRLKALLALSRDAEIFLLDEVFAPLDIILRQRLVHGILQTIDLEWQTLVLATHEIFEVESLLDQVIVLHQGRVLVQEEVETIRSENNLSLGDWFIRQF